MADIYEASQTKLDECVKTLSALPSQVGAVFLIGNKIAGVDLFGSARILEKLLPKLVRSYALDAIEINRESRTGTGPELAETFLDRLAAETMAQNPAIGLGIDYRFEGETVAGGALVVEEELVHMAAFPLAGDPTGRGGYHRFRHGPDEPPPITD